MTLIEQVARVIAETEDLELDSIIDAERDGYEYQAAEVIRVIQEAGYAIVPQEPTINMLKASEAEPFWRAGWDALLAAAPDPLKE